MNFGEIARIKRIILHSRTSEITGKIISHQMFDMACNPRNFLCESPRGGSR